MSPTLIRISSRATGRRRHVRVMIYNTIEEMRDAAHRWSPTEDLSKGGGYCQTYLDDNDRATTVIIRLARTHLTTEIVGHEIHHASTAIYASECVSDDDKALEHLHHWNETYAYLHSDLESRLTERLWAHGYFNP